jgi:hypothetical protein
MLPYLATKPFVGGPLFPRFGLPNELVLEERIREAGR